MDSVITDIEMSLLTDKKLAEKLIVGKIYLVNLTGIGSRVRVEKSDSATKKCLCFLIDSGDEEWINMDEIYTCDPKFQELPAQAICFSLSGLEDFAEIEHAKQDLHDMLANKVLIGEIHTKSEEYIAQVKSKDLEPKIQTILYDTSSQDDVQLNPLILDKICEKMVVPQLQRGKLNHVYASHVSDNGDIYCHLYNNRSSLHFINKVIHQLTGMECDGFRSSSLVASPQNRGVVGLLLIYDSKDKKWFRATIVPGGSDNGKTELCKCVDYGFYRNVELANIYRLDMLSTALNNYPPQAVLMKLYKIDHFNSSVIARLRGLLLPNALPPNAIVPNELVHSTLVQVQVVEGNNIAKIYKRMSPNNMLCSINDTIQMEQDLEK